MKFKVTGCSDCPFCQDEAAEYFCLHPKGAKIETGDSGEGLSYIIFPLTPDDCPLNSEPITITKE